MLVSVSSTSSNRRNSLCLAFKRHIVRESGKVNNIKKTARKYGVNPAQIRRWKASFEEAMAKAMDVANQPGQETSVTND
jgi:transposase-like protein